MRLIDTYPTNKIKGLEYRIGRALSFAYLYAEDHTKYRTDADCFLYVMINAHWEETTFRLPDLPEGHSWSIVCHSKGLTCPAGREQPLLVPTQFTLGPRESAVLISK